MKKRSKFAYFFIAPYLIIFVIFRFIPSIASVFISLTDWKIVGSPKFIGLKNYRKMFSDVNFQKALVNNIKFLALLLPILIIGSLLLAVLLNHKIRGRNFVRTIAIIPYVIIPAIVGVMWNWMYDANFGILNFFLNKLGIQNVGWLITKPHAFFSVSIVIVWSYIGYNMILYLAGLQGISADVYEASKIDGASTIQTFFHITVPLLRPTTSLLLTLTLINIVQIYDQIVVMTGGGPDMYTMTLIQYQYIHGFEKMNFGLGYGSAVGVFILIALIGLVGIQKKIFPAGEKD